jgi:hypothetical protein
MEKERVARPRRWDRCGVRRMARRGPRVQNAARSHGNELQTEGGVAMILPLVPVIEADNKS